MNSKEEQKPFGLKDKIGYACGDFGNNFTFIFANTYLMIFYTDVLGVGAGIVGTLFLVARCCDAFTDVGMGRICDMSKPHKDGRFRVWIKRMAIPMAICSMLMYMYGVRDWPYGAKIAYMFITYILWGSFCYTAVNIPYGCMASVISPNSKDRASLSTFRTVGAVLSSLVIGMVTPQIVYAVNATGQRVIVPEKLTMVAIIYAILAATFYLICYKMTTERVQIQKEAKAKNQSVTGVFKHLLTCRPLLAIIGIALLVLVGGLLTQTMTTYLYKDYFNNTKILSIVSMISVLPMLLIAPVATKVASRFGKKEVCSIGVLVSSIIFFTLWMLKLKSPYVYMLLSFISSIGLGFFNMLIWAFIGDVIDYQEVKTGERNDGTVYAIYSFARKMGQAVAGGIGGFALAAIGYVSSTEGIEQSLAVKNGIYNLITIVPAICYAVVFLLLTFAYPLTKKKVEENAVLLKERRAVEKQKEVNHD